MSATFVAMSGAFSTYPIASFTSAATACFSCARRLESSTMCSLTPFQSPARCSTSRIATQKRGSRRNRLAARRETRDESER